MAAFTVRLSAGCTNCRPLGPMDVSVTFRAEPMDKKRLRIICVMRVSFDFGPTSFTWTPDKFPGLDRGPTNYACALPFRIPLQVIFLPLFLFFGSWHFIYFDNNSVFLWTRTRCCCEPNIQTTNSILKTRAIERTVANTKGDICPSGFSVDLNCSSSGLV